MTCAVKTKTTTTTKTTTAQCCWSHFPPRAPQQPNKAMLLVTFPAARATTAISNVVGHISRRAHRPYFFWNSRSTRDAAMAEMNDRENVELGELLQQWGLEPLQKTFSGKLLLNSGVFCEIVLENTTTLVAFLHVIEVLTPQSGLAPGPPHEVCGLLHLQLI